MIPFFHPDDFCIFLSTIKDLFLERIQDETILLTDKAKAYYSFVLDYPDMRLLHAVVNHARADRNGFNWILVLGEADGEEFAEGREINVPFYLSKFIADRN